MKAMILAGGEGTRLRPLTCDLPKPMVPVVNRPCMEHIINLLKRHGLTRIGVTLAYLPKVISDYFGTGEDFDVNMEYFTEEKPLGTAGCIGNARDFLSDDSFLVISGDALTDIDLTAAIRFHKEKNAMATLVLKQVQTPLEYGVVVTGQDGRIQRFVEKPSWNQVVSDQVNTGIYIFSNKILSYINKGEKTDFAKDIFPRLLEEGQPMYGYVADGYWCDIGDLEAYAQANRDALDGTVQVVLPVSLDAYGTTMTGNEKPVTKVRIGENCQIGKNVSFTPPCLIGDHCIIEDDAYIGQYTVLGNHTVIEKNASLKASILWESARVGTGAELRGALICQNTKVEGKTRIFEHAIVGASCTIGADALIRPNIKVWPGKQIAAGSRLNENVVWDASGMPRSEAPSATSYGANASGKNATDAPQIKDSPGAAEDGTAGRRRATAERGTGSGRNNSLFGERGIEGAYGTSLTPSVLCRIGSAFAASLRAGAVLSIAHDGSPAAGAAALSFLGGAAAGGARCRDAAQLTLPMLRYLVKEYGHQGAAFFRMDADRLHIIFLDANGCDIPHKLEKQMERLYSTCDLPPAPASVIAPVLPLDGGRELYIGWLQRLLAHATTASSKAHDNLASKASLATAASAQTAMSATIDIGGQKAPETCITIGLAGAPFVRETAERVFEYSAQNSAGSASVKAMPLTGTGGGDFAPEAIADFTIVFAEDGERFDLYDETGALVSPERVSTLMSFLLLERYGACALVLPVDQPMIHEWLVKQYGATLTRTGISAQDIMERIFANATREQADAQLAMRYDAIYFALQLALWLQQPKATGKVSPNELPMYKVPLSKLLHTIPHAAMAQQDLHCDFHAKGKVMRKLAEENAGSIRETADGIQIFTKKGWILILPDASRPVVRITTEGYNEEFAKELLVDMERKINGYLQ